MNRSVSLKLMSTLGEDENIDVQKRKISLKRRGVLNKAAKTPHNVSSSNEVLPKLEKIHPDPQNGAWMPMGTPPVVL